jgi:hypothetical protein
MRYVSWFGVGMLLCAMSLSSCTCQKAEAPPPLADPQVFKERDGGIAKRSTEKSPVAATATPAADPTPEQQIAEVALPEDFPSEVPVYEGAKVDQVHDLPNNAHNVIFRTEGSVADVNRFYHEKLAAAGFTVAQQFERPNHAFMTYKKGSLIANVTIAEDARTPGKQVIAIMYEEEQPLPFDEF